MNRIQIHTRLDHARAANARLVLPFELRQKSRLLAKLDTGEEAGLILARGSMLRGGDLLLADDGRVIEVVAADETVSVLQSADPLLLLRAAYHLGNRHVAVQIGAGWLRYLHDHVLDDMVQGLGLAVSVGQWPFEPEGGAYAVAHASHAHSHVDHD